MGFIPVVPHLYYPQFLNDSDKKDRDLGLMLGRQAMLDKCECVLLFKDHGISEGMEDDIAFAQEHNIPVKHIYLCG